MLEIILQKLWVLEFLGISTLLNHPVTTEYSANITLISLGLKVQCKPAKDVYKRVRIQQPFSRILCLFSAIFVNLNATQLLIG